MATTNGTEDLTQLWTVAVKLAKQLETNRELTRQILDKTKDISRFSTSTAIVTAADSENSEITTREVEELQQRLSASASENFTLQETVREYQATLDVLMSKHRNLLQNWQNERAEITKKAMAAVFEEKDANEQLRLENLRLRESMANMLMVMRQAAVADEEEAATAVHTEQIIKENESLRQMLNISQGITADGD